MFAQSSTAAFKVAGSASEVKAKELRSKKQKKAATVVTSLQLTMIAMVALILLTTLTAFADLLKLANSSKQETLKYLTHICVIVPLIATFVCQPKFIAKVLSDKRP